MAGCKQKTQLLTGPVEEPVGVEQARRFLRLEHDADDADLALLIQDARERAERVTQRQLATATWALYLDWFPGLIRVPYPPLQAVNLITYLDADGESQTLSADVYEVDLKSQPGLVLLASGQSWPTVQASAPNVVTVNFTAGYGGAADVPAGLRARLLAAVAHLHLHRAGGVDEDYLDRLFQPWWTGEY